IRKMNVFSERLKGELKDNLTAVQTHLFERMGNATSRMTVLIDDLLEYSHTTKGQINVETIDLNKKVQLVLEDLDLQVQEKNAKIHIHPLPQIKGNNRQIQQLFQNLIGNALKYARNDLAPAINIRARIVKAKDINAALTGEENHQLYHLIEVADNGIGFEQKYAQEIFEIFKRLHRTSEYSGSGVGLSIAKKVVDNHNGYIWSESIPGEGAVFIILLPVIENEA
ncbi:MAG: ATP-binding protein, partial [Chitinophagaceae bacterium]